MSGEAMTDSGMKALTASTFSPAGCNRSGGPIGDRAKLLRVMVDPYEWKSAIKVSLVIFGAFLVLAPALTPDQKKLAAEINHQTLKAAAAIKTSTR